MIGGAYSRVGVIVLGTVGRSVEGPGLGAQPNMRNTSEAIATGEIRPEWPVSSPNYLSPPYRSFINSK